MPGPFQRENDLNSALALQKVVIPFREGLPGIMCNYLLLPPLLDTLAYT
jgi:hypothetical protein